MLTWTRKSEDTTVEWLGACIPFLLSKGDEATDKSFMDTSETASSVLGEDPTSENCAHETSNKL